MRTNVEIENKLYNDIVSYCVVNGIEPVKYIEKALRERLATDKYGDLNQKMNKTEEPIRSVVTNEESHIVSHETELVETEPPVVKVVEKIGDKSTETASETSEASGVEERTIKKKRTLKSK